MPESPRICVVLQTPDLCVCWSLFEASDNGIILFWAQRGTAVSPLVSALLISFVGGLHLRSSSVPGLRTVAVPLVLDEASGGDRKGGGKKSRTFSWFPQSHVLVSTTREGQASKKSAMRLRKQNGVMDWTGPRLLERDIFAACQKKKRGGGKKEITS